MTNILKKIYYTISTIVLFWVSIQAFWIDSGYQDYSNHKDFAWYLYQNLDYKFIKDTKTNRDSLYYKGVFVDSQINWDKWFTIETIDWTYFINDLNIYLNWKKIESIYKSSKIKKFWQKYIVLDSWVFYFEKLNSERENNTFKKYQVVKMKWVDPESFKGWGGDISYDKKWIYTNTEKIWNAAWWLLKEEAWYFIDKERVRMRDWSWWLFDIKGADADSFIGLIHGYWKDNNYVYYYWAKIETPIDPSTFEIKWTYWVDKSSVYFWWEKISDDVDNFVNTWYYTGKDSINSYDKWKIIN